MLPRRALAACIVVTACGGNDTPSERRLVILHTNDEHSHLWADGPAYDDFASVPGATLVGGVARRAGVLISERAAAQAEGIDTLSVSAGDETQGTLAEVAMSATAPDFVLTKTLGYDVLCPGNHEFDQGPAAYAAAIQYAIAHGGLPQIVSTNIHFNGETNLGALYGEGTSTKPIKRYHVIVTPSGIKVGFFGVMGAEASRYAPLKTPILFSGSALDETTIDFTPIYPKVAADVQPTVDVLRNVEKVDLVIAVSHGGVNMADPQAGDDYQLASRVRGIDLIVGGHSHTALTRPIMVNDPDGHAVPIVQAGAFGKYVGRVEIVLREGQRPAVDTDPTKTKLVTLDSSVTPALQSAIAPVLTGMIDDLESTKIASLGNKSWLEDALTRVTHTPVVDNAGQAGDLWWRSLGTSRFTIVGVLPPRESDMLNLASDSMLAMADELALPAAVGIQALGTVRGSIIPSADAGKLDFADLFAVFPLGSNPLNGAIGNPLVQFYVWSASLRAAMELSVSQGYIRPDFFLGPSGMRVEYDTNAAPFDFNDPLNPSNGRVTKLVVRSGSGNFDNPTQVLFDRSAGGFQGGGPFQMYPVITSLYVASFAKVAGVKLFKPDPANPGNFIEDDDPIHYIILRNGVPVTEWEAFIRYVYRLGTMPAQYNEADALGHVPRRLFCTGPSCVTQ